MFITNKNNSNWCVGRDFNAVCSKKQRRGKGLVIQNDDINSFNGIGGHCFTWF